MLFPNLVPSFIKSLPQKPIRLDENKLNWIANKLLINHQNYVPRPICDMYEIPRYDIQTGVRCMSCGQLNMINIVRSWHCKKCGFNDHLAHQQAIKE